MRLLLVFACCFSFLGSFAQSKITTVSGRVVNENDDPLKNVSVLVLGKTVGMQSNDSGYFSITVSANKAFALIFSHSGYREVQKNFFLSDGEHEQVTIKMYADGKMLDEVVVTDAPERTEPGLVRINPKNALIIPSPAGGVEALIKTLVGSNNELTSQYSVRGGNYDENLIYINDFEVYRPYLVSSGQQEGLSLINPELAKNVNFYTGGFQSKYGDKMSSVLDIQYKKPTTFAGSAYVSLLEQGLHLEGSKKQGRLSYLLGARNKTNNNLLSNQPTKGAYIPSASDVQAYVTYQLNSKIQLDLLGIFSSSRFSFYPESVKKTASIFSPLFTANLGLDVYFEGQEKDSYQTGLLGFSVQQKVNKDLSLKYMLSYFKDDEKENFDISGSYLFGDRNFDNTSSSFGQITNALGAGFYQNYGRNELQIDIINASHKGSLNKGKHFIQWGTSFEFVNIKDKLKQWEYQDSAGYNLPYNPSVLQLSNALNSTADLNIQKYSGYLQDNIKLGNSSKQWIVQAGVRYNYNSLNNQLLISPRLQTSWKPLWKKDVVFKLAAGIYSQPPFYRELRKPNGDLNKDILAQKSIQFVAGADYNFIGLDNRPFRFTAEAYYKKGTEIIPYDIENVKIKYLGSNNAKAYTAGMEFRLYGALVKDAQSWLSLSFMRSRENLDNDFYTQYRNAAGEIITSRTEDQTATDSSRYEVGWLRRPSDRFITAGLFLEDYLPTNKNFKVNLNLIYGTRMSYNVANSTRYRNALSIPPYMRVDIGFSALLLTEKSIRRSHSPFKSFENIWLSFEVFNLINRNNTISYQMIKDFSNTSYAIPNRLTPRLVNLKLLARF